MSAALLARGRERFDIFCAPCHSRTGNGDGMIVQRGMPRPPSLHDARLRAAPDRHILQVITHGYGAMYAYADRVPPDDRWAIAAYVPRAAAEPESRGCGPVGRPPERAAGERTMSDSPASAAGELMKRAMAVGAIGMAGTVVTAFAEPSSALQGWLAAAFAWSAVPLGALGLLGCTRWRAARGDAQSDPRCGLPSGCCR